MKDGLIGSNLPKKPSAL